MPLAGAALWLPDYLTEYGVRWQPIPGWETRGKAGGHFKGFVVHHVGIAGGGDAPGLRTVVHGRSDLRNALSNLHTARAGLVSLVAAGVCWHAGQGGWAGLRGNEDVIGDECEGTVGEEPSTAQLDSIERTAAAVLAGLRREVGFCCQHGEWAPKRKVDNWALLRDPAGFRARVAARLHPPATPPALTEEDLMAITFRDPRTKQVFLVDGGKKLHLDRPQLSALQQTGAVKDEPIESLDLARLFDSYPTV